LIVSLSQLESTTGVETLQIRDYLAVVKLRKWLILAVTVAVMGVALFFSFQQTPIYVSEAQVLVQPVVLNPEAPTLGETLNLETESQIAASTQVAQLAATNLGQENPALLLKGLSVDVQPDTEILVFTYAHPAQEEARVRAQAFADAYLQNRIEAAQNRIKAADELAQDRITILREQLKQAEDRLAADPTNEAFIDRVRQLDAFIYQQTLLAAANPANLNVGYVLFPADLPTSPASPNHKSTGAIALIAGLALGVGLAFLRERLDDRIGGRSDLEANVDAAVLAVVPRVTKWRKLEQSYLVTEAEPHSVASEAFRTLRTGLLFAASQREIKSVMVTSSHASEGKTATAANLAIVLAQAGKRVILMSADLRKPRLNSFFGVPAGKGLTNVLAGECRATEALVPVSVAASNLRLMPSGPIPGNPAELLGSEAMKRLIADVREAADFVLIDVAPILAVADAMTMAPMADAVLFVADASRTTGAAVQQARQQLDQVDARVIGAVLNNLDPSKSRSYSARPYLHYRHVKEDTPRRLRVGWGNRR
jgi:capsular exopolysaccharide synthesis family protein